MITGEIARHAHDDVMNEHFFELTALISVKIIEAVRNYEDEIEIVVEKTGLFAPTMIGSTLTNLEKVLDEQGYYLSVRASKTHVNKLCIIVSFGEEDE